jgi:hypothetical protein
MGRSVHVLFVHGVGQHSPLSSRLRAYQALRSDLNSPEAPTVWEDPIPDWRLAEFDDTGPPRYLCLLPRYPGVQTGPDSVYLYEVNYSALAGVIRANQPLDVTQLFIGFDLAVNAARERLRKDLQDPSLTLALRESASIGRQVQKLADVFVAATVPVLGIPALVFRRFTHSFVGAFTRFFEDIATFALDKNGEQLISKHVDRTVHNIVHSGRFQHAKDGEPGDTFVIAAHSLGTLVIHNFLLRHWAAGGPEIPQRLLTYGSPIGLVCWIWCFLDFPRLKFTTEPDRATGDEYFCWTPEPAPSIALRPLSWLNVINFLDPIATPFPMQHVNLAMKVEDIAAALADQKLTHHYMKHGNFLSAHTNYMDDREGFLNLLSRAAELVTDAPPRPASRDPVQHWREVERSLLVGQWSLWMVGVLAIACYFSWLSAIYRAPVPYLLAALYLWPPATIGSLAFFQKLFFGAPTKRSRAEMVRTLRWCDWWAFPYRIRPSARLLSIAMRSRVARLIFGFVPTIGAMILPILWWSHAQHRGATGLLAFVSMANYKLLGLLAVFMVYAIAFALSEFTRHWRQMLTILNRADKTP